MKKTIKSIGVFCIALPLTISAAFAQNVLSSTHSDTIPEYIEIGDDEVFYSLALEEETEKIPVSGATLAWRDIRPETDPNVKPSRSVTVGLNQNLEVEYPGNEWIYLGEAEETNHLRYYGRKLGRDSTTFTLCSKDAGTVILHFYCIDPLNGTSISDYLEVIIEDRTTGTSKTVTAPSYANSVPSGQHSNDFEYVTPTVKDVHKEPDTPYTLEVPNPPKENTVAVPKTSSTKNSSTTTTKPAASSTTTTTTTKPATSSSTTTTTKPATSSSTTTTTTKPATSSTTTTTTTKPATSSSTTTTTTKPAASSTTGTASESTSTTKPASASIATGNPTTRSISRTASSPVIEDEETESTDYFDSASSSAETESYPTYGTSSSNASSVYGSSIGTSSDAVASLGTSASGSDLLKEAHTAYDKAQYAQCLSLLDEFFNTSGSDLDEALYLQGQAYEAPGSSRNIKAALECYETLVNNYPYSKYWTKANERVIYIKRFYINIR